MLESKLIRASQAILKNTVLLVCSGSGMQADCKLIEESPSYEGNTIPVMRGTRGLWTHYPAMRRNMILYEDLVSEPFFKMNPHRYWYVYGDLFNKMQRSLLHKGYSSLV